MITTTTKELLTLQEDFSYAPYQAGDDINRTYIHVVLSNGYECYICGWWPPADIQKELTSIQTAANARLTSDAAQVAAVQSILGG